MIIANLSNILKTKFNLPSFRLGQKEIIESILSGKDVLAIMPTGGGKSLCYQLPAFSKPGITIVVSPLIALMNDQVRALNKLKLPAGCINSAMSIEEKKAVFQEMEKAESYILYLSPERVAKSGFSSWLQKQKVNYFAIDEAHCVSQWGHDFRPEYSQLNLLRNLCPQVPVIGLTATATPLVKKDIKNQLKMKSPDEHVYGFYRPNLYYQVEYCEKDSDKIDFVLQALKQTSRGRILIYCGTRQKTEDWAHLISQSDASVAFYHAGLGSELRTQIERQYQSGEIRILAATNAFGMGIDHPDVRLVLHTQMPGNIESYYQEIGRAGRDGLPATCLLVYSKKDKGLQSFFIQSSKAEAEIRRNRWQALDAMVQYSEGSECRHADILTYFRDQKRMKRCGHCDSCNPHSTSRILKPLASLSPQENKIKLRKKEKSTPVLVPDLSADQEWRSDSIREWRREYAKEHDIPAFMVFSDKTLRDLVIKAPTSEAELLQVYGLGEKKVSVFGKILLAKIHPDLVLS